MQTYEAPARSLEQRREALVRANTVRIARADWKRDVKARRVDPLGVLLAPPEVFWSMKVIDVLLAMPKIGQVKAKRVLALARVSPSKTLGGLTERQRLELVALLGRRP